ncbi:hypothetical protein V6N12_007313 [Hibiscus sabdariffa]|uniref:Reverse transcriptase zinc-binding domain-containing protein n=1 Tax=Hibiscus sabdariffa TaxID=183260 RepID=A0ABR2F1E3_9ROSI
MPTNILLRIAASVPPNPVHPDDKVAWAGESSGKFSIKSTYAIRLGVDREVSLLPWNLIQRFKGLQKILIFLWLVCCNKIMTNEERVQRNFSTNSRCSVCNRDVEDVNHVLRLCPAAYGRGRHLVELMVASSSCCSDVNQESRQTVLPLRCWIPHVEGWFKLNTDGACRSSDNLASCGGVLRDHARE